MTTTEELKDTLRKYADEHFPGRWARFRVQLFDAQGALIDVIEVSATDHLQVS